MSYKNKTYIIFDADNDMSYYRLMTAWKKNEKIDFDFHNAHDIYSVNKDHMEKLRKLDKRDGTSREETYIKGKLKERLTNTKQVIVLVGDSTKDLYKYVRWEIEVAIDMDIPIIAVNLNKVNEAHVKTPPILKNKAYFVSVPYEVKKIKHALDKFPTEYHREKKEAPSSRTYNWNKISL